MRKVIAAVILALAVTSCDKVSGVTQLFRYSTAAATAMEAELGMKPQVGFNWHNGRLATVTVQFPALYDKKPLPELAAQVREVVTREFQQKPNALVASFVVPGGGK